MSDEVSYTASIKVDRATRKMITDIHGPSGDSRRVVESFRLTVRAPTLDQLSQKIKAHLALVDDDDFGSEQVTR